MSEVKVTQILELEYKQYKLEAYFNKKENLLQGKIKGISGFKSIYGSNISELKRNFSYFIDLYTRSEDRPELLNYKGYAIVMYYLDEDTIIGCTDELYEDRYSASFEVRVIQGNSLAEVYQKFVAYIEC